MMIPRAVRIGKQQTSAMFMADLTEKPITYAFKCDFAICQRHSFKDNYSDW